MHNDQLEHEDIFKWDEQFIINIDVIDNQHKNLVNLTNQLVCAIFSDNTIDRESIKTLQKSLKNYTLSHFKDEEDLMLKEGIDVRHYENHVNAHQDFIAVLSQFFNADINNIKQQSLYQVAEFLITWLIEHILTVDIQMSRQISLITSGHSAKESFEIDAKYHLNNYNPLLVTLKRFFSVIYSRNNELTELNNKLELRVKQRTAKLEQLNKNLETWSNNDYLTNLYNRRFAMSYLQTKFPIQPDNLLAIIIIDMDKFKQVNDQFGHAIGDEFIKHISAHLCKTVHPDDIVCRLGGDEFLIICCNKDKPQVQQLAHNLQTLCPIFKTDENNYWQPSLSIGIAFADEEYTNPDTLLHDADCAMYKIKRQGGNGYAEQY